MISKLFYSAYHKSLPDPLETELGKLCCSLAMANLHFFYSSVIRCTKESIFKLRVNLSDVCSHYQHEKKTFKSWMNTDLDVMFKIYHI